MANPNAAAAWLLQVATSTLQSCAAGGLGWQQMVQRVSGPFAAAWLLQMATPHTAILCCRGFETAAEILERQRASFAITEKIRHATLREAF